MQWNPKDYGDEVASILALAENGRRLIPLVQGEICSDEARRRIQSQSAQKLFPSAPAPEAAASGLYLYFSCWEDAHQTAQSIETPEGSYWHAIVHRQEPDAGNASYWFKQVGEHPIFPQLLEAAQEIAAARQGAHLKLSDTWNPFAFIDVCQDAGNHRGSELERAALEIQRAEWQLLFDFCARRRSC